MNYKAIKSGVLLTCILACMSIDSNAQKVKYKDLYVLLSANDFKQAEPFLRKFMVQDEEHPNATMYMGRLYEYKFTQKDILKNTDEYLSYIDSAIVFYRAAFNLIDEKEIKKHDEYYQDYFRRDLRTGDYGVKLADVSFDIEKKIAGLEASSNNLKTMKTHFDLLVSSYEEATSLYNGLVDDFKDMPHLLLVSNESTVDSLKLIGDTYEQLSSSFNSYKTALIDFSKSDYNQKLDIKEVETLTKLAVPDFYENQIEVYELNSWSTSTSEKISYEIAPLKASMSEYDQQLDDLFKQVKEDSVIVQSQLTDMSEGLNFDELSKYDNNPLPSSIFSFKINEINYYSAVNQKTQEGQLDSADLDFQLIAVNELGDIYTSVQESYSVLSELNVYEKSSLYQDFVAERYSDVNGVTSYIAGKGIEIDQEALTLKDRISNLEEASIWGIIGNDSIPLYVSDSIRFRSDSTQFTYHTLDSDTTLQGFVTAGVRFNYENMESFTAVVSRDRLVDTLFVGSLKSQISRDSLSTLNGWIQTYSKEDDNQITGLIQVLHMESNYEISHVMPNEGIQWTSSFENDKHLFNLNVDPSTSLIVIKLKDEGDEGEEESLVYNFDGALLSSNDDR